MATKGLLVLACAGAIIAAGAPGSVSAPTAEQRSDVADILAVQTAMQQGRDLLLHNRPQAAVEVLEAQLPRINGNPKYLALLRDAYDAYIKDLRITNQQAALQIYVRRRNILEPGSPAAPALAPARALAAAPTAPPERTLPGKAVTALTKALHFGKADDTQNTVSAAVPRPTAVRAAIADEEGDDPFRSPVIDKRQAIADRLARAEDEFGKRRYREAGQLFEQANRAREQFTDASRERWAYCKLFCVVEELNAAGPGTAPPAELESEVRTALMLAPRLDYGKNLLHEIETRRSTATTVQIAVRHYERNGGWAVAETANFRVYHNQSRDFAEQAARAAERTRGEMRRKWFGAAGENWSPRCEIYLHASGSDYNRATGAPAGSPGHSSFRIEHGRVLSRRIDLHCDDPNLLAAVLPHETTHTVLAGNFGEQPVPRWVDEGVAVLTEPREKINLHLRNLPRHRQERELFTLRQLMQMNEYPEPRYIGPFYAQSVSLVEFLSKERGPQVFTQFVREGMRSGYESALQKHYGYRGFADLEERWVRHAFAETPAGLAQAER